MMHTHVFVCVYVYIYIYIYNEDIYEVDLHPRILLDPPSVSSELTP